MKIIFLDYDGVLNNLYWLTLHERKRPWVDDFDPARVSILNQICDETGAKVVVTSSWKECKEAHEYLKHQGIPIIDKVKDIYSECRGEAVDRWLEEHLEVEKFLILDDEVSEYSSAQMEHLICTKEGFSQELRMYYDCVEGLQKKHIIWAKAMLGEKDD